MPQYPGFVGGSGTTASAFHDGEQTVNFYVEQQQGPGGKARLVLMPTPGVEAFAVASIASVGRGSFASDGRAGCVIGSTFFEVAAGGTLTPRGTVEIDANPVTFCSSGQGGNQWFITSGNNGYIFDLVTNTLTLVRTGATRMGAFLDGYFLALDAETGTLYLSDLYDGMTWDPTQFAQRSNQADPWIALLVHGSYIRLFGERTSDVWTDTGAFPLPFTQHPAGTTGVGIGAPFSAKILGDNAYWLASTNNGQGQVVKATGFTPEIVSTFAVQVEIEDAPILSDAIGDAYEMDGHAFYVLTLPSGNLTFCYDATVTQEIPQPMRWTTRATWISEESRYVAWRPVFHFFAFSAHLMLDRGGSAIYRLSSDLAMDVDARPIRRLRRPPALWNDNEWVSVIVFELHAQPGVGLVSGQGEDPQVALRVSPDGGKAFGAERLRSLGKIGQTESRARWVKCGRGRQWMPEVVVTDPVRSPIVGASVLLKGAAA